MRLDGGLAQVQLLGDLRAGQSACNLNPDFLPLSVRPRSEGRPRSGHIARSTVIWIAVPLVLGAARTLRRDVS
jgi:hypothetical protein